MSNLLNLSFSFSRKASSTAFASASHANNHAADHPSSLVLAFVETGDERCPLAGIWSRLAKSDQPDQPADEPRLSRPAMRRLLLWRAFHSPFTPSRYSSV